MVAVALPRSFFSQPDKTGQGLEQGIIRRYPAGIESGNAIIANLVGLHRRFKHGEHVDQLIVHRSLADHRDMYLRLINQVDIQSLQPHLRTQGIQLPSDIFGAQAMDALSKVCLLTQPLDHHFFPKKG